MGAGAAVGRDASSVSAINRGDFHTLILASPSRLWLCPGWPTGSSSPAGRSSRRLAGKHGATGMRVTRLLCPAWEIPLPALQLPTGLHLCLGVLGLLGVAAASSPWCGWRGTEGHGETFWLSAGFGPLPASGLREVSLFPWALQGCWAPGCGMHGTNHGPAWFSQVRAAAA